MQLLKSRPVDKILFVCSILFVLTTVFTVYHWSNNAFFVSRSGPHGIALNDDGLVATGELGYINIWNNQHCIDQLDYHIDKVYSMAYSSVQKFIQDVHNEIYKFTPEHLRPNVGSASNLEDLQEAIRYRYKITNDGQY